jgi:ankyrin repeat protein
MYNNNAINKQDIHGNTALIKATKEGNVDEVKSLLTHSAEQILLTPRAIQP